MSGERLLNMCVEQELVIGNSFFKKKEINKYTWIRVANGRVIERALMDYVLITKRMVGRLKDVHVFRGVAAGMSDHFLVEAEVVVAKEWGNRVVGCTREVVKVEELKKPEKKQEYQDKLKEAYDRVKEREAGELEEEWRLMKESLVGYASNVCGKRLVGGCMRRGSEWWNEGVKMKVEEKNSIFIEKYIFPKYLPEFINNRLSSRSSECTAARFKYPANRPGGRGRYSLPLHAVSSPRHSPLHTAHRLRGGR